MRKNKKVIRIFIVIAILVLAIGIIYFMSRRVPKGDISVRMYNEYGQELSHEEYFLDDKGRIIKEIDADEEGVISITENEYDSVGRLTGTKYCERGFLFFNDYESSETYSYYNDSELLTDYVKAAEYINGYGESTESGEEKHREYDTEGRLVSEKTTEYKNDSNYTYYQMDSNYTEYNPSGIIIYTEATQKNSRLSEMVNGGKPFVKVEYDPDTKIIREYDNTTYSTGADNEFATYATLRNLTSEIQLSDDGKYEIAKEYQSEEDEDGNLQTVLEYLTYYDYSPDDERATYEASTYDQDGELVSRELFDNLNRRILCIRYQDGVEELRVETDYNAEDPDFPGEQVYVERTYSADENGNMKLWREEWMKKISYGVVRGSEQMGNTNYLIHYGVIGESQKMKNMGHEIDDFEVYRSYRVVDNVRLPVIECSFRDNGFIKEKHQYSYHDESECTETICEYDEHGNCLKLWEGEENREKILKYEWKYSYRK